MVASSARIVNATISSTRVSPRWFFLLEDIRLLHQNLSGRSRHGDRLQLRVPKRCVSYADRGSSLSYRLERQGQQCSGPADTAGARRSTYIHSCLARIVRGVFAEADLLAIAGHQ